MPSLRYIVRITVKQLKGLPELARRCLRAFVDRIAPGWRLPVLAGLCCIMVLILGMLVTALLTAGKGRRSPRTDAAAAFAPLAIAAEDVFLPEEPDFTPDVILEREPRSVWTGEDVRPFWKAPLDYGSGVWKEGIGTAVDKLLERVP